MAWQGLGQTKGAAIPTGVGIDSVSLSPGQKWQMANSKWLMEDLLRPRARGERKETPDIIFKKVNENTSAVSSDPNTILGCVLGPCIACLMIDKDGNAGLAHILPLHSMMLIEFLKIMPDVSAIAKIKHAYLDRVFKDVLYKKLDGKKILWNKALIIFVMNPKQVVQHLLELPEIKIMDGQGKQMAKLAIEQFMITPADISAFVKKRFAQKGSPEVRFTSYEKEKINGLMITLLFRGQAVILPTSGIAPPRVDYYNLNHKDFDSPIYSEHSLEIVNKQIGTSKALDASILRPLALDENRLNSRRR